MSLVSCFCTVSKATRDRGKIVKHVHIIYFLALIFSFALKLCFIFAHNSSSYQMDIFSFFL